MNTVLSLEDLPKPSAPPTSSLSSEKPNSLLKRPQKPTRRPRPSPVFSQRRNVISPSLDHPRHFLLSAKLIYRIYSNSRINVKYMVALLPPVCDNIPDVSYRQSIRFLGRLRADAPSPPSRQQILPYQEVRVFRVWYEKCVKMTWRLIIRRHPQNSCAATLGSLLDLLELCLERLPNSFITSENVMLMRPLRCIYYFHLHG